MAGDFQRSDITLDNWRISPFSRYAFQNLTEFVPVAPITLASRPEPAPSKPGLLASLSLHHPTDGPLPATRHFERSGADSFVVMRDWEVLDEWRAPHADPAKPHIIFSVSKSITGMLAGIAVEEGKLDPDAPVSNYVEVMPDGAYADASVRHLLDMSVSLDFEENYLDRDGQFARYRRSTLWNPPRPDTPQETVAEVLVSLPRKAGAHGKVFFYASPNTDLAGLVIERATGVRFHEYLAERLWKPMGAFGASWVTVDRAGTARAAGGICVTPRDLARFGQLVLDGGRNREGKQLIPEAWIADMHGNGDPQAWLAGSGGSFPGGRYRSFWYETGDDRGSFCGIGIHGQWLWVDPQSRLVLVRTSSRPVPSDEALSKIESNLLGQIGRLA